jgi:hypothetical protein
MKETGSDNVDLNSLVDGWSKVVVKVLQAKIARMNIHHTGSLFDSLNFNISGQGFSFQIYFTYNIYGVFVDMGVGRNRKANKRKEWESRIFYAQVMTLGELARKQCGEMAAKKIVSTLNEIYDLRSRRA